jgi:hypothetical protein
MHDLPECILNSVQGRVWEWVVLSAALTALREQVIISSTLRRTDGVLVRAIAEKQPASAAEPVPPRLEDAYLHHVRAAGKTVGGN